jgi:hypothetical protein
VAGTSAARRTMVPERGLRRVFHGSADAVGFVEKVIAVAERLSAYWSIATVIAWTC